MTQINISAIVVGRNEAKKLKTCLASLSFCDEILYADLSSSDNSIDVANLFDCKIYSFQNFGPSCEYTQAQVIKFVRNDWVLLVDPDEVLDNALIRQITAELPRLAKNEELGDIYVPWQFYFGTKRLKGTVWGYKKDKGILVHRDRYEILPITHYGRRLKPGFKSHHIVSTGDNVLHHYWMEDRQSFISKHKKYLKDEGQDRFKMGERIKILGLLYNCGFQFFNCYFLKDGFKDGLVGLYLSLFWTWYITISNWRLYKIEKNAKYDKA